MFTNEIICIFSWGIIPGIYIHYHSWYKAKCLENGAILHICSISVALAVWFQHNSCWHLESISLSFQQCLGQSAAPAAVAVHQCQAWFCPVATWIPYCSWTLDARWECALNPAHSPGSRTDQNTSPVKTAGAQATQLRPAILRKNTQEDALCSQALIKLLILCDWSFPHWYSVLRGWSRRTTILR